MNEHDESCEELCAMFREGCSASALLRQIAKPDGNEKPSSRNICRVLDNAFSVGLDGAGRIRESIEFGHGDVPNSMLNWQMIPAILAQKEIWDQLGRDPSSKTWYQDVTRSTFAKLKPIAEEQIMPLLSEKCRANMTKADRSIILDCEAMRMDMWERMTILAQLVERLQQRLDSVDHRDSETSDSSSS